MDGGELVLGHALYGVALDVHIIHVKRVAHVVIILVIAPGAAGGFVAGRAQDCSLCYRNRIYGIGHDDSGNARRLDTGTHRIYQFLYLGLYLHHTRHYSLIDDSQSAG